MAKVLDLKRKVNNLVKKSKVSDEGGFSYLCNISDFECVGRKGMVEHLKENAEVYSDLKLGFEETSEKDFQSQLSKLIMNVPFSDKDAKGKRDEGNESNKKQPAVLETKNSEKVEKAEEIEKQPAVKNYPLTLDFMRTIDGRTTRIPNYGSLVGRIARLIAMIVKKKKDGDLVELTCRKSGKEIAEYTGIFIHIEKEFPDFLTNLYKMFPPAKKRMDQFMTKAAENFDLEVPTWEDVEKLQRLEKEKENELKRLEMKKKLEEAKKAGAEIKRKREEAEKNRLALKRKQEEEAKAKEFKMLKIDPNDDNAQEKLRCKKEILRIEQSLKQKSLHEMRKTRLTTRLNELKEKLKKERDERIEKSINKRMETCLENLSPKQLRKLCLEYFNNMDNRAESTSWAEICESVKIGDDYEFLTDFLGALYDLANFHEKKSFKVGHILVTSKQSVNIQAKGVRSFRDFVKKDSWRIPSSWDFDIPEDDLGEEWNRKDDSRLLIGASRFGKNLQKIMECYPSMATKALDSSGVVLGSVKRRFGYLLNIYMNRGVAVEEFGDTLYSVDVDEEASNWEAELEEEGIEDEVMEIEKDDTVDPNKTDEESNAETTNGSGKTKEVEDDNDQTEEIEEVEEMNEEDL